MRGDADPDAATQQRYLDFLAGAWLPGLGSGARPEPLPGQRIRVTFGGAGAGRAALTWGQRDIWATMRRQRNWLPQGGRRPLAPGTRVEDVAAELAYLHSRYQSMRTRLVFGDPPDGAVQQWVASEGETFLEVYDTPPGQDPDALAARVEAVYRHRPYDLRVEWPVRMAVVRSGGACTHLVVLMHHLALDAGGAAVMMREVAAREHAEPTGMQPLEQAAWQASEAGRRHDGRTLRYFARALDRLAAGPPPTLKPGPRRQRHWSGCLISPALADAVATIGARRAVDDAAVLTAVTAIAFARVAGTDRVLIRPRVGNRFRPALSDVVCFVAQSGLLVLELGDTTFDEAVDRARGATLAAVKNAYFDPDALEAMLGRFAAEHERFAVYFNDRHIAAPNARDPQRPRGASTFAWLHRGPEPAETLSITIDDAEGALAISVHIDTHVIAPEMAEELVWGIERAAVEAAADGDSPTGIRRTAQRTTQPTNTPTAAPTRLPASRSDTTAAPANPRRTAPAFPESPGTVNL
ncbi:condensation domain-containing protein [Catenulispora rubra]|uniref:condensation domain-containing protein n=1 Tax=Catenulispora rubra TaxID=280293 RepID=UPI0018926950|nr:condensation domain-containing protein [Catenulispora rubra]